MDANAKVIVRGPSDQKGWSRSGDDYFHISEVTSEEAAVMVDIRDAKSAWQAQAMIINASATVDKDFFHTPIPGLHLLCFDDAGFTWSECERTIRSFGVEEFGLIMHAFARQIHSETKGNEKIIIAELSRSMGSEISRRYQIVEDTELLMLSIIAHKNVDAAVDARLLRDAITFYGFGGAVRAFDALTQEGVRQAIDNEVDSSIIAAV